MCIFLTYTHIGKAYDVVCGSMMSGAQERAVLKEERRRRRRATLMCCALCLSEPLDVVHHFVVPVLSMRPSPTKTHALCAKHGCNTRTPSICVHDDRGSALQRVVHDATMCIISSIRSPQQPPMHTAGEFAGPVDIVHTLILHDDDRPTDRPQHGSYAVIIMKYKMLNACEVLSNC